MPKFTKYNNPSKKRVKRKTKEDIEIDAIKNWLIDSRLGYNVDLDVYVEIEKERNERRCRC